MTFTEIRTEIMDRLGYTSTTAQTRVGRLINKVYRAITTSIGIRRARYTNTSMAVTVGNSEVTFSGAEKLLYVWTQTSSGVPTVLTEVPIERLRESVASTSDTPKTFGIKSQTSNAVTIRLDSVPETAYTIYADYIAEISDLSGSEQPAFPESFHDIIIEGVLRDEYRKLEKIQLSRESENTYQQRLSDLRMFLAISGTMDMKQGLYAVSAPTRSGGSGGSSTQTELNDLYAAEIALLAQVIW